MSSRQYTQVGDTDLAEPLTTDEAGDKPSAQAEDPMPCTPRAFILWVMRKPQDRIGVLIYVIASVTALILAIICIIEIEQSAPITQSFVAICLIEMGVFGFAAYGFRNSIALREQVGRLADQNRQFKQENVDLANKVDSLHKGVEQLNTTHDRLVHINEKNKENIKKFSQLQNNLAKFAGGNLDQMAKIKEQTQKMNVTWRDSLVKNERSLILKCYEQVQDVEGADDLNQAQFEQMLGMLPPDYKAYFERENKTWAQIAGDDGLMQFQEFVDLCDVVVDERVTRDYDDARDE